FEKGEPAPRPADDAGNGEFLAAPVWHLQHFQGERVGPMTDRHSRLLEDCRALRVEGGHMRQLTREVVADTRQLREALSAECDRARATVRALCQRLASMKNGDRSPTGGPSGPAQLLGKHTSPTQAAVRIELV